MKTVHLLGSDERMYPNQKGRDEYELLEPRAFGSMHHDNGSRIRIGIKEAIEEVRARETLEDKFDKMQQAMNDLRTDVTQAANDLRSDVTKAVKDIKFENWARDKQYITHVRPLMFHLLEQDSGTAYKLKSGEPDWDSAYEAACWASPEIREKMLNGKGQTK